MSATMDAPRPYVFPEMEEPKRKGRSCVFWGCAGCLTLTLVFLIIAGIAVHGIVRYLRPFTSDRPMEIPIIEASPERYQEIKDRVDTFVKAVEEERSAELILTAEEINILIACDPNWKELKGKAYVKIEGDELKADASIPLDNVPFFRGRYLNGTLGVKVSLKDGVFLVTPETLIVNNKPLPEHMMKEARRINLAKDVYEDKEKVEFISKFKSIEVQDGKIAVRK